MAWVSIKFYLRANSFWIFVENKNVQYLLLFFIKKVDRVRITRLFCLFLCTYIDGVCQVCPCCGGGGDRGDHIPRERWLRSKKCIQKYKQDSTKMYLVYYTTIHFFFNENVILNTYPRHDTKVCRSYNYNLQTLQQHHLKSGYFMVCTPLTLLLLADNKIYLQRSTSGAIKLLQIYIVVYFKTLFIQLMNTLKLLLIIRLIYML